MTESSTESSTAENPPSSDRFEIFPGGLRRSRYLTLSVLVLVLDQWSKVWIRGRLSDGGFIELVPNYLNLIHTRNTGVAFGLFATHGHQAGTILLSVLGLAALTFVLYYFRLIPLWDRLQLVSLALILGGAVGNLIDRISSGGVTDFIDFYVDTWHWHTFNVADSAITVGICLMILATFRTPPPEAEESRTDAGTADEPSL